MCFKRARFHHCRLLFRFISACASVLLHSAHHCNHFRFHLHFRGACLHRFFSGCITGVFPSFSSMFVSVFSSCIRFWLHLRLRSVTVSVISRFDMHGRLRLLHVQLSVKINSGCLWPTVLLLGIVINLQYSAKAYNSPPYSDNLPQHTTASLLMFPF